MHFELSPQGDLLCYSADQLVLRTQGNPIAANVPFVSLEEAMDYYHNVLNWQGGEASSDPVVEPLLPPGNVEEGN